VTARGKEAAALALHRFGFGPAGDIIAAIANDPQGALLADLERSSLIAAGLPSSAEAARAVSEFRAEQTAEKKREQRAKQAVEANNAAAATNASLFDCKKPSAPCVAPSDSNAANAPRPTDNKPTDNKGPPLPQLLFQKEAKARFDAAVTADIGFSERLVWFWSNHFCVSEDKVVPMAGPFEREAIRPHVLGKFAELLRAVESHPAMLVFLDNVQSMGADSTAGINRDKGLNENLAREILELHTLGVRTGYSQADVTSFANVLTGWTWMNPDEPGVGGEFVFNPRFHQPGAQTVLGKGYPDRGVEQGRAVLADLARNPATAQHVAQKLARHFVADDPPPALVAKLAKTFNDTDGNLKDVAKTLVTADESWTPQRQKLKAPAQWVMAILRLARAQWPVFPNLDPQTVPLVGWQWAMGPVLGAQASLGEPLWRVPAPNGWPDTEAAWIDGIPRRLDIATEFANRFGGAKSDPLALLDASLGPLASAETRQTIARAESRAQAWALLAMAPEFLRS
jgi:uncharacterized protein (DUF1800 family)